MRNSVVFFSVIFRVFFVCVFFVYSPDLTYSVNGANKEIGTQIDHGSIAVACAPKLVEHLES